MEDEMLYIIMEYAEKGDLHKLFRSYKEKKDYFPEDDIWFIGF